MFSSGGCKTSQSFRDMGPMLSTLSLLCDHAMLFVVFPHVDVRTFSSRDSH